MKIIKCGKKQTDVTYLFRCDNKKCETVFECKKAECSEDKKFRNGKYRTYNCPSCGEICVNYD